MSNQVNAERLLQRFLEYVQIDCTAVPGAAAYPSSAGQLAMGRLLVDQLKAMGWNHATQDEHGIVLARIPGNVDAPTIVLNSHLDTSPETSGTNVRPQVIRDYDGTDITLPGDPAQIIRVSENHELPGLVGKTLITSDGTTLLGGDDKAGVAIIMEVAAMLADPLNDIMHGPVCVLFTCDEEIGLGVQHIDVPQLKATACYTLDGPGHGQIDVETFSADVATVVIEGINIHPSIGKGRMVNAVRCAGWFVDQLPRDRMAPESTDQRDGFLHPYSLEAAVDRAKFKILLREFDTEKLAEQADLLRTIAARTEQTFPGSRVTVEIDRQYRNLADGLRREPRAVRFAEVAHERLGLPFQQSIIRGGTDGSQFTELGLPTPNLSSGQHNPHSPQEFACLDEMVQAAAVTLETLKIWGSMTQDEPSMAAGKSI